MQATGEILLPAAHLGVFARVDAQALYEAHRQRVYHLCLRLGGGNVAWAEDATQDVFVRLLEKLPRLADQDDLAGWVYRVTVNTCLTRLKREGSTWRKVFGVLRATTPAGHGDTPERRVQVKDALQGVLAEVQQMPARERVVFCMRYLDDLPQQQIAATLSMSKGYVSKLLARARARLADRGWEVADA